MDEHETRDYLAATSRGHRCHFCARELLNPLDDGEQATSRAHGVWRVWLHHNFRGAFEAAEAGCLFFVWLVSEVKNSGDEKQDQTFELVFSGPPGKGALDADTVEVRIWTGLYVWPAKKFDVLVDYDDPAALVPVARMIDGDVNSKANRYQIQQWLTLCNPGTHPSCFARRGDGVLPTRVLDLGTEGRVDMICLRSLNTKITGSDFDYAALSYCWGGQKQTQTTMKNYEAHSKGIATYTLPQTILDAIETARFAGFRYLWVDSLCIIQDSLEDRTSNCANMQHYYSNAALTIVAANASTCAQGFLRSKTSTVISDGFYFPMRLPGGGVGAVKFADQRIKKEPIDRRAWTLQEQLLSKRTLNFATGTVQWKCRRDQYRRYNSISILTPFRMHGLNLVELWKDLVTEYTSRNMSNADDRLIAISGLAEQFGGRHPEDMDISYLAGIWRYDKDGFQERFNIGKQLLWKVSNRQRSKRCGAPSWSWASVTGRITFPTTYRSKTVGYVTSCYVRLTSANAPYGSVLGGRISLRCKMKPYPKRDFGRFPIQEQDELWEHSTLSSLQQDPIGSIDDSGQSSQWCPNPMVLNEHLGVRYIADTHDDERKIIAAINGTFDVWCLEILSGGHTKESGPRGLIVVFQGYGQHFVKRIGLFCLLGANDEGQRQIQTFFYGVRTRDITLL